MHFDSSMTIIYSENGRKIIIKTDFSKKNQQKDNFFENLTCGCHGNVFVGITSKSSNPAKITLGFHGNLVT